ncbi:NACHT, LRR and PYD domains-containing protein 5 [Blyttiomyces sp. JEL0837]|nr:NACHT, LRR and PYD domains-containing protein 5 [Blyttiomyces sp. JEL0837]
MLSKCGLKGHQAIQIIEATRKLASLEILNLSSNTLDSAELGIAVEKLVDCHPFLHNLDLSSTELKRECFETVFNSVSRSTSLRSLDLSLHLNLDTIEGNATETDLFGEIPDAVVKFLQTPSCLVVLTLSDMGFTDTDCDSIFQALLKNNTLEELCLSKNTIGVDSVTAFCNVLNSQSKHRLRIMDFSECEIDSTAVAPLILAIKEGKLSTTTIQITSLDLRGNPIQVSDAESIVHALHSGINSSLEWLHLGPTTAKFNLISLIRNSPDMKTFKPDQVPIGDIGCAAISTALLYNTYIEKVDLACCGINQAGAHSLATLVKSTKTITSLTLDDNDLKDSHSDLNEFAGIVDLINAFKANSSIVELGLMNVRIGVPGARAIATVMKVNTTVKLIRVRSKLDLLGVDGYAILDSHGRPDLYIL